MGGACDKSCPDCHAVHGEDADRCACGHVFASEASAPVDDELYQAYLAARITQALEALDLARASLRAVPGDYARALNVMQQVHELQALRLALDRERGQTDSDDAGSERAVDGFPTPTEAFRAAQAARAEAIARRKREAQRGMSGARDAPPAGDDRPSPALPTTGADEP